MARKNRKFGVGTIILIVGVILALVVVMGVFGGKKKSTAATPSTQSIETRIIDRMEDLRDECARATAKGNRNAKSCRYLQEVERLR